MHNKKQPCAVSNVISSMLLTLALVTDQEMNVYYYNSIHPCCTFTIYVNVRQKPELSALAVTRHRASTSMYSLTFRVRVTLPERHHCKPAVRAAAVMLRTPPIAGHHRPASHAHFPYTELNFENAPITCRSLANSARTPAERSHYVVISRDGRKLVTRVCVMLP